MLVLILKEQNCGQGHSYGHHFNSAMRAGRSCPRRQRIGNMAEWLRRQTRNLVGIALVGSNPAVVV